MKITVKTYVMYEFQNSCWENPEEIDHRDPNKITKDQMYYRDHFQFHDKIVTNVTHNGICFELSSKPFNYSQIYVFKDLQSLI